MLYHCSMAANKHTIAIIGAGPGGCATALSLAGEPVNVLLLDKATFPRDKICGDGLSPDVLAQFDRLKVPIGDAFAAETTAKPITNIRVVAPNRTELLIPLKLKGKPLKGAYVSRMELDNFLLSKVRQQPNVQVLENTKLHDLTMQQHGVELHTTQGELEVDMVIGADGAQSFVARKLTSFSVDSAHHGAGLRQYWENVSGIEPEGTLDLCFPASIQPGYFWIFPLANNRYNVGVWMISSHLKSKNVNLRGEFERLIAEDPQLAPKFANAQAVEQVRGFGLPLGTGKRTIAGNRFVLVGDAAGLIDPFTGEGIGNAIRSGRLAADVALRACAKGDWSAEQLSGYAQAVEKAMRHEFNMAQWVVRLQNKPRLLNWLVGRLAKNTSGQKWLAHQIEGTPMGASWVNPLFYLRGLFGPPW